MSPANALKGTPVENGSRLNMAVDENMRFLVDLAVDRHCRLSQEELKGGT